MLAAQFEQICQERIAACTDVLLRKADEYATDHDRLHNFRVAGILQREEAAAALGGMMAKHIVSVYDLLEEYDCSEERDRALWDEKIGDTINYLLLLNAVLIEDDEWRASEASRTGVDRSADEG